MKQTRDRGVCGGDFFQSHALLCQTCTHEHNCGDSLRRRLRGDITVADRRHGGHLEQPISAVSIDCGFEMKTWQSGMTKRMDTFG